MRMNKLHLAGEWANDSRFKQIKMLRAIYNFSGWASGTHLVNGENFSLEMTST